MQFEWDEAKREANKTKHGVDLVTAARIFQGATVEKIDGRTDYGEQRVRSVGFVGEQCYVVVWTWRGSVRRLISAWMGGRSERERYQIGNPR